MLEILSTYFANKSGTSSSVGVKLLRTSGRNYISNCWKERLIFITCLIKIYLSSVTFLSSPPHTLIPFFNKKKTITTLQFTTRRFNFSKIGILKFPLIRISGRFWSFENLAFFKNCEIFWKNIKK